MGLASLVEFYKQVTEKLNFIRSLHQTSSAGHLCNRIIWVVLIL